MAASDGIVGISSMAMRRILTDLTAAYGGKSGQSVAFESVGGVDAERRVSAGEAFDVVVLADDAVERLADTGRVHVDTIVRLAQSRVAVAIPAGAERPAIDSADGVRQALLAARRIGYSTGPSGRHLLRLLESWNLSDVLAPRLVEAPPGVPVGTLIARGDADIGFQQRSELVDVAGIEVVGTLPRDIEAVTGFSGAVCVTSARRDDARALLAYLASPAADAAKRRQGMEP